MVRTGVKTVLTLLAIVLLIGATRVQAQTFPSEWNDTYKVSYFSNSTSGQGTVRIVNPGYSTVTSRDFPFYNGYLCAMIYVFAADQEMSECCGCLVSPNELRTISIAQLTGNPLAARPVNGVVKIVSADINAQAIAIVGSAITLVPVCDPTGGNSASDVISAADQVYPDPTLRAWATHVQRPYTATPATLKTTEEEFADAGLNDPELNNLQTQCSSVQDSGHGTCQCGSPAIPALSNGGLSQ